MKKSDNLKILYFYTDKSVLSCLYLLYQNSYIVLCFQWGASFL